MTHYFVQMYILFFTNLACILYYFYLVEDMTLNQLLVINIFVKLLVFGLLGYWVITHIYLFALLIFYIYLVSLFYLIQSCFRVFYFST